MKILQLCKKFPFPLKDGEAIAVTNLSSALRDLGCEITLLSMNTKKHYFDIQNLSPDFNHYEAIHLVPVDNSISYKEAFLNLFSSASYHVSRFVSADFEKRLIQLLKKQEFDIVQLETLYLAPYIPTIRKYSGAIVAMRAHNVEHEIWDRVARSTKFLPKKMYLNHLAKKLKSFEVAQMQNYDLLIPISKRDLHKFKQLGYRNEAAITPIGIEAKDYLPDFSTFKEDISISFIGSLDWMPNQEGLMWFLNNVWGRLHARFPNLVLHVAGRNTPGWIKKKRLPNVTFYGEIENAVQFINRHPIMIVPLLAGSGMRAKILEGMALGKVVLTTSLGLEGIPARHLEEVLVANTMEEIINCVQYCHTSNGQLKEIGEKAHAFVKYQYDRQLIARKLLDAYEAMVVEAI